MIRRTFWLAAGAAVGIAGYRRLARLLHAGRQRGGAAAVFGAAGEGRAFTRGFMRDVRAGMAEYMDRHSDS